jgi:branched-chain amino acid transport system ATP-binding protein
METLSAQPSGNALLAISDISLRFGGIKALQGVSFEVERGSICGLIGPNGAGKTSLFNCLSRLYNPQEGEISFEGQRITKTPPHRIAALGIGRTFQNLALFRTLSVADNVRVGCHCRTTSGFASNAFRTSKAVRDRVETESATRRAIEFLELGPLSGKRVSDLPFGTQKRVELARALAGNPTLLLLDEPACGLNHEEVSSLADLIKRIRDELHITVLLVEHHMGLVMGISNKVVALNFGQLIAQGAPREVATNDKVIKAYLGGGANEAAA